MKDLCLAGIVYKDKNFTAEDDSKRKEISLSDGYDNVEISYDNIDALINWLTSLQQECSQRDILPCEHVKVFSRYYHCTQPPQHHWICEKCGKQGFDNDKGIVDTGKFAKIYLKLIDPYNIFWQKEYLKWNQEE